MGDAVLVIDMTRAFMEKGHSLYTGDNSRKIIPNIQALLERELKRNSKILYLNDNHEPDDLGFKMFQPHSIAGTAETEIILGGCPAVVPPAPARLAPGCLELGLEGLCPTP